MSGIYIHIPFCKHKCSYCDFHFSTSLRTKEKLIEMLQKELILRKNEITENVKTIYFGGGTPSLLNESDLENIFETIYKNYKIAENPEITLEANPDDLDDDKFKVLKKFPINRLSIGVQSFFDEDLKLMGRIHSGEEAEESIKKAQNQGFENITIDLIYGGMITTDEMWQLNLNRAISLKVPHISSYALTVEPKTLLNHKIKTSIIKPIDEEKQNRQFQILCETLTENEFIQYEISNFAKKGFFSVHNGNYWKGIPYLGIGPSAHSYDGKSRSWNIANNNLYIKSLAQNKLPLTREILSTTESFNELIMIRLRTIDGICLDEIKQNFPISFYEHLLKEIQIYIDSDELIIKNNHIYLTQKGKFFADGIISQLFII